MCLHKLLQSYRYLVSHILWLFGTKSTIIQFNYRDLCSGLRWCPFTCRPSMRHVPSNFVNGTIKTLNAPLGSGGWLCLFFTKWPTSNSPGSHWEASRCHSQQVHVAEANSCQWELAPVSNSWSESQSSKNKTWVIMKTSTNITRQYFNYSFQWGMFTKSEGHI